MYLPLINYNEHASTLYADAPFLLDRVFNVSAFIIVDFRRQPNKRSLM
jgi:hypothetical protein